MQIGDHVIVCNPAHAYYNERGIIVSFWGRNAVIVLFDSTGEQILFDRSDLILVS